MLRELLLSVAFLSFFSGCATKSKNTNDAQRNPANRKAEGIKLLAGGLTCFNKNGQSLNAKMMNEYGPFTISYFLTPGSVFHASVPSQQQVNGILERKYGEEGSNLTTVSKPDLNVYVFKIQSPEKNKPESVTEIEFVADPETVSKGWGSTEIKFKADVTFFFHNKKFSTTGSAHVVLGCVLSHIDNLEL